MFLFTVMHAVLHVLTTHFHFSFLTHNRDITDYGLPKPEKITTELEMEKLRYDPDHQAALLEEMNVKTPNNPEQQQVFDIVKEAIDTSTPYSEGQFIFINGPAGSGKTNLSRKSNAILYIYITWSH